MRFASHDHKKENEIAIIFSSEEREGGADISYPWTGVPLPGAEPQALVKHISYM